MSASTIIITIASTLGVSLAGALCGLLARRMWDRYRRGGHRR